MSLVGSELKPEVGRDRAWPMGLYCSVDIDDSSHVEKDAQEDIERNPSNNSDMDNNNNKILNALNKIVKKGRETLLEHGNDPKDEADYFAQREEVAAREASLAFDHVCHGKAESIEVQANRVLQAIRKDDAKNIYGTAPMAKGHGGQKHKRFMGDHFLYNADLIDRTKLYQVASKMPKGAHLHIHFNANLLPNVLIDIAKTMDRMFITSDVALVPVGNDPTAPGYYDRFDQCKIQFRICSEDIEKEMPGNLFDPGYQERHTMKFSTFLEEFGKHYPKECPIDERPGEELVDKWLREKLVFNEQEAHGWLQTAEGAWEKFNTRTQMMKGLFNYETAYREYTWKCLQEFVDDNIQYAEIRPNFMRSNQLWTDDGKKLINNEGIMSIIIEVCKNFQTKFEECRDGTKYFGGIKVIYCTPRSFKEKEVEAALHECLEFKKRWPEWIAGFDLVGEESQGKPLKAFVPQFLEFKKKCRAANVDIPFLFHCGETLDVGNDDTDGNLFDALLLGAKRIGHGFALPRHPYVMEQMKKKQICVELCPISNEILGLTPRVNGHSMYILMANNVHCTVSTDNGTLFRSRLSHDFYQVFAGKTNMTLHGWRQLIEWSIEHSCMEKDLQAKVYSEWEKLWNKFCQWIVDEHGWLLEEQKASGSGTSR